MKTASDSTTTEKSARMSVCRAKGSIAAPLAQVWEFIIDPRNLHLWVPPIKEPVIGPDRPMRAGDRLIEQRKDFFRRETEELIVEEVIPYRSFRVRVLPRRGSRLAGLATVNVEEAGGPGTTKIEEVISYSLGDGAVLQWIDRLLLHPVFKFAVWWKSTGAFRRLDKVLAQQR